MSQELLKYLRKDDKMAEIISFHCPKRADNTNIFSEMGKQIYGVHYYSWLLPKGSNQVIALKMVKMPEDSSLPKENYSLPSFFNTMVNNCSSLYVQCNEKPEILGISDCNGSPAVFFNGTDYSN